MRSYIIESVMPTREVHLLAGAPGAGKTTHALDILSLVQLGEPVYGYPTHPTGVVWVSCDRSEDSHIERLESLSIPAETFPFHAQRDSPTTIERVVIACASKYPQRKLIFIDGFGSLVPEGKLCDYANVARFLATAGALCQKYDRTILGCVHSSKQKDGQGYSDPRSQVLGSVAWAGFCDLMLVVARKNSQDPADGARIVYVCTRASAGDFSAEYQLGEAGRLVPSVDKEGISCLDFWLSADVPVGKTFNTKDFLERAAYFTIKQRTAERWLDSQVESERVIRLQRGLYKRKS